MTCLHDPIPLGQQSAVCGKCGAITLRNNDDILEVTFRLSDVDARIIKDAPDGKLICLDDYLEEIPNQSQVVTSSTAAPA